MALSRKRKVTKRQNTRRSKTEHSPARPEMLQYKVVELSTVDEGTIELAINDWVALGWSLDGIQFAMRDSSKRPSMAFVLFTRSRNESTPALEQGRSALPQGDQVVALPTGGKSAWDRLRQLADEERSPPERSEE